MSQTTLVTGATGFVGRGLTSRLVADGVPVRAAVREYSKTLSTPQVVVSGLSPGTSWGAALESVAVVIHAAARVHVMRDRATDPLAEFRRVNVEGTLRLAQQAAESGVRRFVFLSSIKVNGEVTLRGQPFTELDPADPGDPYGISKYEAEQELFELGQRTGMEIVVIRPVLVYGVGVKGNFLSMLRWVSRGLPLPFGAVRNKRSFVALGNLVDLAIVCARHPAAPSQVFLVSDGEDLSTAELLRRTGDALGRPARLISVPEPLIRRAITLFGREDLAQRLLDSLQVDISKACHVLGWKPPVRVEEGLLGAVTGYRPPATRRES